MNNKIDPRYVDDPFEEERPRAQKPKKLFGTTYLQTQALQATGRSSFGFRDNKQFKAFQVAEGFALGSTEEALMWKAWLMHRIEETAGFNRKIILVNMDDLIRRFGVDNKAMKIKREEWFLENRAKVLNKGNRFSKLEKPEAPDYVALAEELKKKKEGKHATSPSE